MCWMETWKVLMSLLRMSPFNSTCINREIQYTSHNMSYWGLAIKTKNSSSQWLQSNVYYFMVFLNNLRVTEELSGRYISWYARATSKDLFSGPEVNRGHWLLILSFRQAHNSSHFWPKPCFSYTLHHTLTKTYSWKTQCCWWVHGALTGVCLNSLAWLYFFSTQWPFLVFTGAAVSVLSEGTSYLCVNSLTWGTHLHASHTWVHTPPWISNTAFWQRITHTSISKALMKASFGLQLCFLWK